MYIHGTLEQWRKSSLFSAYLSFPQASQEFPLDSSVQASTILYSEVQLREKKKCSKEGIYFASRELVFYP